MPAIQQFVVLAERARATAEFEKAIKAASPIIRAVVNEVLIPDTRTFAAEKGILIDARLVASTKTVRETARTMVRLANEHDEPVAGSNLERGKQAAEQELVAVLEAFDIKPKIKIGGQSFKIKDNGLSGYPPPAGTREPYSELAHTQLEQYLTVLRAADATRQAQNNTRGGYKETLDRYVVLLAKIDQAMLAIESQLGKPRDLQAMVGEITTLTLELRSGLEALRKSDAAAGARP